MEREPEAFYAGGEFDFFLDFQCVQMPAESFFGRVRNFFLNVA
jgi:hypothetical protein